MSGNRTVEVDFSGLFKPGTRPSLAGYITQLWKKRQFIIADAKARAFQEQRDYLLGRLWLVLQPLAQVAMYGVLFGLLLQTSRNVENFIGYLFIGITYFGFMVRMTNAGSGLVRAQKNLFVSFNFPRAAIVIGRALRMTIDAAVPATAAIVVGLLAQFGEPIHWTLIFVPPLVALLFLFGTGLMLITARITAFIPDSKVLVRLVSQAWFYSSCVFYPITRFADRPVVMEVIRANPGYRFLEAIRDSALYGLAPSFSTWMILIGSTILVLFIGLVFFWQAEERYIEVR